MQLKYVVHSVAEHPIPVIATIGGKDIEVQAPGIVVELVRGGKPTQTLSLTDVEAAREVFTVGASVVVTYAKDEG